MNVTLDFGLNKHNELIHISEVERGRGILICPYCRVGLIARKGLKLQHHFAHDGESCRESSSRQEAQLPAYKSFNLSLSGWSWGVLQRFHDGNLGYRPDLEYLEELGFLKYNRFAGRLGDWQLTTLGKIPFGEATLAKFAEAQRTLIEQKHTRLLKQIEKANTSLDKQITQTDLNLYEAQLKRLVESTLYFLEIKQGRSLYYKIGVTTRAVEARVVEIEKQLHKELSATVKIKVLRQLRHQGFVEHYFKHRYATSQHTIGKLTEYFRFKKRRNALSDLTRLGDRQFSTLEDELFYQDRVKPRGQKISEGMARAAAKGVHVGRPQESPTLTVEKYPQVVEAIERGLSRRKASAETGVSVPTIRKVDQAMAYLSTKQEIVDRLLAGEAFPQGDHRSIAEWLGIRDYPHEQNPFDPVEQEFLFNCYAFGFQQAAGYSPSWVRAQLKRYLQI